MKPRHHDDDAVVDRTTTVRPRQMPGAPQSRRSTEQPYESKHPFLSLAIHSSGLRIVSSSRLKSSPLSFYLQQCAPWRSVLFLPQLDVVFINPRLVLLEISQPPIQLSLKIIQISGEIVAVEPHPDVFLDRDLRDRKEPTLTKREGMT
jgi:hypothetical protein